MRPRKDIGKVEPKIKKKKDPSDLKKKDASDTKSKVPFKSPSIKEEKNTISSKDGKSKMKVKVKQEPQPSPLKEESGKEEEKKPIGIPVEVLNIETYKATDPLTVAQELKEDEAVELTAINELREKNKHKLLDENLEGPYCLCRKGIDGFMIRCNLCFNWYHTSCICPPKTVHGKSIGKGYNSWSASREVHYLCTLCCRSRRPRLDNILQLLMSLQKLPVRVPEGEALQFLTERAMNWQDRAKQALADPEVTRILTEAKSQAEKLIAEKQATAISSNSNHSGTQMNIIFYQKLLAVKKAHADTKSDPLKVADVNHAPSAANEQKNILASTLPAELSTANESPIKETVSTTTPNEATETTLPNEPPSMITALNETSTIYEAEKMETDQTIPVAKLETHASSADLECTEEMISGSPETAASSKAQNSSSNDPNVVRIQSASSSRAQSPIDVCTPLEPTKLLQAPQPMNVLTMKEIGSDLLDQMEELMFEGELLEVGLDEVQQIWAILQIQRPLTKDACNVMVSQIISC